MGRWQGDQTEAIDHIKALVWDTMRMMSLLLSCGIHVIKWSLEHGIQLPLNTDSFWAAVVGQRSLNTVHLHSPMCSICVHHQQQPFYERRSQTSRVCFCVRFEDIRFGMVGFNELEWPREGKREGTMGSLDDHWNGPILVMKMHSVLIGLSTNSQTEHWLLVCCQLNEANLWDRGFVGGHYHHQTRTSNNMKSKMGGIMGGSYLDS